MAMLDIMGMALAAIHFFPGNHQATHRFALGLKRMGNDRTGEDEKITLNPFSNTGVQLARLVHTHPEGEDWLYELKYDGYRILNRREDKNTA